MRNGAAAARAAREVRDVTLEHGCILCGGRLELRFGPAGARTYCATCRWLSHPTVRRDENGKVHVVHRAGGRA
jgi:hypothetical protein